VCMCEVVGVCVYVRVRESEYACVYVHVCLRE
jgi:hypothetical protein